MVYYSLVEGARGEWVGFSAFDVGMWIFETLIDAEAQ